jgi:hypothetical protein
MGDCAGEADDGIDDDVATEPPVLHPPIPKASTTSPATKACRIALKGLNDSTTDLDTPRYRSSGP